MSHVAELIERHAAELRVIAHTLPERFAEAAGALEEPLGQAGLREWARIGLELARLSRPSSEVAVAFFEASPAVGRLGIAALSRWAEISAGLADRAPRAAAAFIEATPAALAHLEPQELEAWAGQGRRLCRGSWKSAKLAGDFFRIGPGLLESLSLRALDRLVDLVGQLAQRSHEMASLCLHDSPPLLARLAENDREPFLAFAQALCGASWVDTHPCFERGPGLLEAVRPAQRSGLLELAAAAASVSGGEGFSLFVASSEALATLDPEEQAEVVAFAQRLAPHGARAAIESVISAPKVRERLTPVQARRWSEAGLELLTEGESTERAESYFRIESALAEEMLGRLTPRVELVSVGSVLRLYAKALTGEQVLVHPSGSLIRRNIGWATEAVYGLLRVHGLGFCCVDEPELEGLMPRDAVATSPTAYVRFHSRDAGKWYEGGGKERYNYLYDRSELEEWVPRTERLNDDAESVYIFFNNCHAGHAAVNAEQFSSMLSDIGLVAQ